MPLFSDAANCDMDSHNSIVKDKDVSTCARVVVVSTPQTVVDAPRSIFRAFGVGRLPPCISFLLLELALSKTVFVLYYFRLCIRWRRPRPRTHQHRMVSRPMT